MAPTPSKGKVHKSSGKTMRKKEHESSSRLAPGNGSHSNNGGGSNGSTGNSKKEESVGCTSSSTTATTNNSNASIDLKDSALTLPIMSAVDHNKFLPRYTNLLESAHSSASSVCSGDTISMEELDNLQLELELLASSMLVRQSALTEQISILEQMEKGKIVPRVQASPGKRVRTDMDSGQRPSKKAKEGGSSSTKSRDSIGGSVPATAPHTTPPPPPSKVKCSIVRNEPLFDVPDLPTAEQPRPPPPRNDITNRFWAMVDTYCQEMTADDIKALEDLIASHNDDPDLYKTMALGRHYTLRWAQEDFMDEQKEGSKMSDASNGNSKKKGNANGDVPDKLLREVDLNHSGSSADDTAPLGPLAQRLLAGLVDERGGVNENCENKVGLGVGRPGFLRSLGLGSGAGLEKRLRRELQEHGLIDPDHTNQDEDDEILQELKRCQAELRAVSAHNRTQLNRLLKLAREALYRHDLKKKLRDAEAKVIEAYKNISSLRVKKKPPSKRDKDAAWKAIKEREVIVRQLDTLNSP